MERIKHFNIPKSCGKPSQKLYHLYYHVKNVLYPKFDSKIYLNQLQIQVQTHVKEYK